MNILSPELAPRQIKNMNTYFLQFKVIPTIDNEQYDLAEGALASCWVLENNPQTAATKAVFQISKFDWEITNLEISPMEVEEENFAERDIGLEHYKKAQVNGMAIVYVAWSRDKRTSAGPIELKSSYRADLQGFLNEQKRQRNRGRCLHYDAGHRCREIIHAHSIQKSGLLSTISENGHVYTLSADMSDLKKNFGITTYKKKSINKVSTFLGFCKHHDNELFKPIDDQYLIPTDQQVLLYAYRSLSREMFVKENVLNHLKHWAKKTDQKFMKQFLEAYKSSTAFGFKNLERHKLLYGASLKSRSFHEVRYVLFLSNEKPTIAFSGLLYPDFDFMGRQLQELGNHQKQLELITFCSAPMKDGWGYLFSWHNTSSRVCTEFMRSLATMMFEGHNISDLLFRMVVLNCENCAISPEWWELLSKKQREEITAAGASNTHPFSPMKNTYLSEGLEGVSGWHFESVISNMD